MLAWQVLFTSLKSSPCKLGTTALLFLPGEKKVLSWLLAGTVGWMELEVFLMELPVAKTGL